MFKANLEFDFSKREKEIIYKALIPDIQDNERVKTKVINKNKLEIKLEAKDITALQANINTLLRLIRTSKDLLGG